MNWITLGLIVTGYVLAVAQFGPWGLAAVALSVWGLLLAIRRP